MATTIKLKNGSGAPLAGDLVQGEPALDLTNKRLYTEDSGGTVIEIGTSPSTIDINAGTIDGTVIGGSSAAAGTFTTFTSTGIDDNATSTAITIDSSENVGIGISSPLGQLHINTETAEATQVYVDGEANQTKSIEIRHYDTSEGSGAGRNLFYLKTPASGRLDIGNFTDGSVESQLMTFLESGNVGIGTASPATTLDVKSSGSTSDIIRLTNHNESQHAVLTQGGTSSFDIKSSVDLELHADYDNNTSAAASNIKFLTDASERMRIDSSGNVTVGGTTAGNAGAINVSVGSPGSTVGGLQLWAGTSGSHFMQFGDTASGDGYYRGAIGYLHASDSLVAYSAGAERMRIDSSGNLLVGTDSTTISTSSFGFLASGSVVGRVQTAANVAGGGAVVQAFGNLGEFRVLGDGDAQNTNNSYGAISDERVKSNIVDASSQIDDIMAVQVRSYTLNETGATHIGVVAQELEASGMSGLVKTDDEGMKAVKYSVLYMKAIKALQEAVTRIETLEAEVAALKGA